MSSEIMDLLKDRLARAQLDALATAGPFPNLDGLEVVTGNLPEWWTAGDNLLMLPPGSPVPILHCNPDDLPTGAVLALNCLQGPSMVMLWGSRPLVLAGAGTRLPNGNLYCGGGSTIVVGDHTGSTWAPVIDARNGGLAWVGPEGLWASDIRVQTDDMHAVRDLEGRRINAFGGVVVIERHVWLGLEVMVLEGARIEADVIVGARSVVKGRLTHNSIYAGAPVRLLRSDVTWDHRDVP